MVSVAAGFRTSSDCLKKPEADTISGKEMFYFSAISIRIPRYIPFPLVNTPVLSRRRQARMSTIPEIVFLPVP